MDYTQLVRRLGSAYDRREAQAVARLVLEQAFGIGFADALAGKVTQLPAERQAELEKIAQKLAAGVPVQYVLGRADFAGRCYGVGQGVLIPRPETERLCVIAGELLRGKAAPYILDIGTGSGCIACTLALDIPGASVEAWDISPEAIATARRNAARLGANVEVRRVDALAAECPEGPERDLVVSNPPYVLQSERAAMSPRVLLHEPPAALFVPDADPLLFYRAIASHAARALRPGGWLCFEINPLCADALCAMLAALGFGDIATQSDIFGKTRYAICRKK